MNHHVNINLVNFLIDVTLRNKIAKKLTPKQYYLLHRNYYYFIFLNKP